MELMFLLVGLLLGAAKAFILGFSAAAGVGLAAKMLMR
jgi:hypothetical protein